VGLEYLQRKRLHNLPGHAASIFIFDLIIKFLGINVILWNGQEKKFVLCKTIQISKLDLFPY